MAQEKQTGGKDISRTEGRTERMPRSISPFEDMDRMFENFFPQNWLSPFRMGRLMGEERGMWPRVDVIDRDNELLVRAEIPGVDKQDIDVSLNENTVTIKGSKRREHEEEKGDYYRCEISQGAFSRTITLPSEVDTAKSHANFKDGMLELHLPKVEHSKRRSIPVS